MGKFCEFCGNPTPNGTCTCQEYINKYGNTSTSQPQQKKVSLNKNDIEYQPIISDEPSNTDLAVNQSQQIQPKIQVPVYTQPYMKIPTYYQANPQAYVQQQSNPIQNNNYIQSVANVVQQAKINIQETDLGKIMDKVDTEKLQESIDNIPIKNSFVKKNLPNILLVLAVILLFLPFAKIKILEKASVLGATASSTDTVTIHGFYSIITGIINFNSSSILSLFLILLPIIVTIMSFIKPLKKYKHYIYPISSILLTIFNIATLSNVKSLMKYMLDTNYYIDTENIKLSVSPQIGFFLTIIIYIASGILGYALFSNDKNQE